MSLDVSGYGMIQVAISNLIDVTAGIQKGWWIRKINWNFF